MKYVGVDLHKQVISVCVVIQENGTREVVARRNLRCKEQDRVEAFFAELKPFQVVVEATASYEWFVSLVEPLADRVLLAHPKKLRVIAESTRKTDKLDAQVLAEFLALDMIPEAHRPTPRVREHRVLVRYRTYLQRRRSALKTKLRGILTRYNADVKNLFSKKGRETYLPPTGQRLRGWNAVRASWEKQADMRLGGKVEARDVQIVLTSASTAVVTTTEVGNNPDAPGGPMDVNIRSTKVYRREDGRWRLIHDHADLLSGLGTGEN